MPDQKTVIVSKCEVFFWANVVFFWANVESFSSHDVVNAACVLANDVVESLF